MSIPFRVVNLLHITLYGHGMVNPQGPPLGILTYCNEQ